MSGEPVYVLGDDGNFYRDPVVGVAGEWFVRFDRRAAGDDEDDAEPELVVRRSLVPAHAEGLDGFVERQVRSVGMAFYPAEERSPEVATRDFTSRLDRRPDLHEAISIVGICTGPIPSRLIYRHGGQWANEGGLPPGATVVYTWPPG